MSVDKSALISVLSDLQRNRNNLAANLKEIENAILCLERLYKIDSIPLLVPKSCESQPEPLVSKSCELQPETCPEPVNEFPNPRVQPSLITHPTVKEKRELKPSMGLTEAILVAVKEEHDQIALIKRVIELRPESSYNSACTQVSTMFRQDKLRKDDNLIVREVEDGKIQGLPPMSVSQTTGFTSKGSRFQ